MERGLSGRFRSIIAAEHPQHRRRERTMAESKTTTDQPGTGRQQLVASPFAASPFQLMRRMSEEMDRMFDRVLGGAAGDRGALAPGGVAAWSPRVEVFQKQDKFIVRAELPGISKDDVQVELGADQLIVRGQRREEHEEEREGFYRSERSYGSFYRAVPLPEGVIAESADASFRDGVLEITMQAPPSEVSRTRRLEIK
jgi:HSP20 family protein